MTIKALAGAFSALALAACATTTTEITTSFADTPIEAQEAFNEAAEIWGACLVSKAPIKIHVQWIPRGPTGFAFPNGARSLDHLPVKNVWYPTALSNALAGQRLSDEDDMNLYFSARANWHYPSDDPIADGQVDFVNVALHEIAHGLGVSSASFIPWEENAEASLGLPNPYVSYFTYTFPLPELDGTAMIYDSFIRTGAGRAITSFDNQSAELTAALNDPDLYFDGPKATAANGGERVAVTPGNISHIPAAEDKPTPIMLADSGQGESIRTPDAILLAMMEDLGWEISAQCKNASRQAP